MSSVNAQEMRTLSAIQDSIINQLGRFPQEKIHLHTDRTMYVPGEKIWFKAYVVDAYSHQSPTYSQYAYIELIDASDSLVHRVMVRRDDNGLFHGTLLLSKLIPEGDYTLRAYTRYMENQGDDYFFNKPIRIGNLTAAKTKQAVRKPGSNYDVSFYPEGGYLTEGAHCRVAIKALNQQGASENITGEIVDKEGNVISEVTTVFAGMGSFGFIPEQGATYYLLCKNSSGQENRFKLPPAKKTYTIGVNSRNNRHFIQLLKSPGMPEETLYLLVHCKGEVQYFDAWNHNNEYVLLPNDLLPSGVIQIVLFDAQMNPVSERLIFNKNEDRPKLVFSADKPFYQNRERVISEIFMADNEGNPLTGHVSVAVTDDKDIAIDTLHTIVSSLLLSSELRGYIESPGYYLQDHPRAEFALDLLMMTHGWRRYEVSQAIKGNYTIPKTGFEVSKEISGSVRSLLLGRLVANGEVILISNDGSFGQTMTDSVGMFSFFLHHPDSARLFVQAKTQKGKPDVVLGLNHEEFPKLKHVPVSSLLPPADMEKTSQPADITFDFLKKAGQRAKYDEDMKYIDLSEVTVTAKRIEKKDEARLQFWANSSSDKTIYREEIEKSVTLRVTDLLFSVSGIQLFDNGTISIRGGGLPLVLIDGVQIPWPSEGLTSFYDSPMERVSVHDIESIDIFKGPSTSLFGVRGGNGVISITTKRGE